MKLLRSSAIALVLAGTAISLPARAADSEMTVFDWAMLILGPLFIAAALWRLTRTQSLTKR